MSVPGNCTTVASGKKHSCSDLSSERKKEKKRMSSKSVKEVHSIRTTKLKFNVGDVAMVEEKKSTIVTELESGKFIEKIECHTRRIGDKVVTVTKKNGDRVEETDLSADELKQFNDQWKKASKTSSINENQIHKAIKAERAEKTE